MADRSRELIALKNELSDKEFRILDSELERRKKSVALTYALWFLLSVLGVHKFYLGQIGAGLLYIIAPFLGVLALFIGFVASIEESPNGGSVMVVSGFLGPVVYVAWWLIDLLTIPNQVNKCNENIEIETIASFKRIE